MVMSRFSLFPFRNLLCTISLASLLLLTGSQSLHAALTTHTDFAAFVTAAGAANISEIGFEISEGFTIGDPLNTLNPVGDVTFNERANDPSFQLAVFGTNDTVEGDQYVGLTQLFGDSISEFEIVDITFGAPRSATGLFVQYDPLNLGNTATMFLSVNGGTTLGVDRVGVDELSPFATLPNGDEAFFIGIVEDTGANVINSAVLEAGSGTIGYTVDRFVSAQTVPEPGSFAVLALASAGMLIYRRRRK